MSDTKKGYLNPDELTPQTFIYYARLYLINRIYDKIPVTANIEYGDISRLINIVNRDLFKNLNIETNKVILINYLYSMFMSCLRLELSREELYSYVEHLASYDPENRSK